MDNDYNNQSEQEISKLQQLLNETLTAEEFFATPVGEFGLVSLLLRSIVWFRTLPQISMKRPPRLRERKYRT